MLQKRSSRWAGAKALFVVPLAGLALGAFAETVYLCPSGKIRRKNAAFQIFDASDSSRMTVRVGDPADKRIVIVGGTAAKHRSLLRCTWSMAKRSTI